MARNRVAAAKPQLLYLSPVVPLLSGNGLAMRAGMVLRVLAQQYDVSLLLVRLYAPYHTPIPDGIARLCQRIADLPAPSAPLPSPSLLTRLAAMVRHRLSHLDQASTLADTPFRGVSFEALHVFRLSMLPFARPYLAVPRRHLDLDDIESLTHRRLADLYQLNGNSMMAQREDGAAQQAEALERAVLSDFHRVYVCSADDRELLRRHARADIRVLPNALPVPPELPVRRKDGPFTFLFVGTLGYYPNEDAICHFCTASLPLIRAAAGQDCRLRLLARARQRQSGGWQTCRASGSWGAVPDMQPCYQQADAVIVPIRAGGGTRIKVLEAFSYQRPVVSTTIGVEGIAARAGEHVLLGNTPTAFADQCLRLMSDPLLAERLTTNAYRLFLEEYTIEAVARRMEAHA